MVLSNVREHQTRIILNSILSWRRTRLSFPLLGWINVDIHCLLSLLLLVPMATQQILYYQSSSSRSLNGLSWTSMLHLEIEIFFFIQNNLPISYVLMHVYKFSSQRGSMIKNFFFLYDLLICIYKIYLLCLPQWP